MKKIILLSITIATFIISCGPSNIEIEARKQFVADSIEKVKEDSLIVVKENAEKERIHNEKIEVGKTIKANKLKEFLSQLDNQLNQEKRELNKVNEWQLGRRQYEKQSQIENQKAKIYQTEALIKNVNKEIALANIFEFYDFQETPQGTVEHLFYAAKNKDYSKMRHLLDPYGEFDDDVFSLCFVEMLPIDIQEKWVDEFNNGRIMSDPIINEDKCTIEIAVGSASNKLEKINLINRFGKWYIISI